METRRYTPDTEQGGWLPFSSEQRQRLQRSLDISGVGSVLMQPYINRTVEALSNYAEGPWVALDHKPGSGLYASSNRRTAGTTGGGWIADTSDPTEETGTYAQTQFNFRTAATRMKVTRRAQSVGRTYADVLATELGQKVPEFVEKVLENAGIQGDNAADSNQPSGLLTLIMATSSQVVANTSASAGDSLVLANLDAAIDAVKGPSNRKVIFASRAGKRKLNAALQAQQHFNDKTTIRGGFRVMTYDDIPIVGCTQIPDVLVWNGTSRITAFTGGATTAIIVVSMDHVWWEDLDALQAVPLARTSSQYDQIDLFCNTVLNFANTLGGSVLAGVAP